MSKRTDVPYKLKELIYNRDDYTCKYCGYKAKPGTYSWKMLPIEIDHVIPVSKGGKNIESNLVCACRRCNRKKHNKIIS